MPKERKEQRPTVLEQHLAPLITRLKQVSPDAPDAQAQRYTVSKDWFQTHTENLISQPKDLVYLCKLPTEIRKVVTYPVIGNLILDRFSEFTPQTDVQKKELALFREIILEGRFNNYHTKDFYEETEAFNAKTDEMNSFFLDNAGDAKKFFDFFDTFAQEIDKMISIMGKKMKGVDLGHGIAGPVLNFGYLLEDVAQYEMHGRDTKPLNVPVIVVDDENAEGWFARLTAAGVRLHETGIKPSLSGSFPDGETALREIEAALNNGTFHPDTVILSDLDLDPNQSGKMDGIAFVEQVNQLVSAYGINPIISVFSFNNERLEEADRELRRQNQTPQVFEQVDINDKFHFTATRFRASVFHELERRNLLRKRRENQQSSRR